MDSGNVTFCLTGCSFTESMTMAFICFCPAAEVIPICFEVHIDFSIPVTEHLERMVANMCNYSTYILEKGMQRGMQQGIQQGMQQGMQEKEFNNIKTLMETMNWNPLQAMNALRIPEEEQKKYTQLLKQ